MAEGYEPRPSSNQLGIGGFHPSIGRTDGKVSITIPIIGKYNAFSLSKTTNINMDLYTINTAGVPIICNFESSASNIDADGHLYLRFIPTTDITQYYDTGRPIVIAIQNSIIVTLS